MGISYEAAEVAVETTASLAARAFEQHHAFALVVEDTVLEPQEGIGQLESVLDALARVEFAPDRPAPNPPVSPEMCILVTVDRAEGFGRVMAVGRGARLSAGGEEAAA